MPTININVPDSFTLSIGGESKSFKASDVAQETWEHFLWTGAARVASYSYSSVKAAACKTDDGGNDPARWTDDMHEAQVRDVFNRIVNGDWSRRGTSAPSDPVGALANRLAIEAITGKFVIAAGLKPGVSYKMATIRDNLPKEGKTKLAKYGEFGGKNGNTFTWSQDAIAAYVEANGLRDEAKRQLDEAAKLAESADVASVLDDL